MRGKSIALCILASVPMLAGCATPYGQGRSALRQGQYDEAAGYFEKILSVEPERLDVLTGLGVARYKLGALDEAAEALGRVVARAPAHAEARLYLGLTYLRKGEDGLADEQLAALPGLRPEPRLAAQIERGLRLIRLDQPLSDELRGFLAASLEHEMEWAREVEEARHEARLAQHRYEPFPRFVFVTPRGRLLRCL